MCLLALVQPVTKQSPLRTPLSIRARQLLLSRLRRLRRWPRASRYRASSAETRLLNDVGRVPPHSDLEHPQQSERVSARPRIPSESWPAETRRTSRGLALQRDTR